MEKNNLLFLLVSAETKHKKNCHTDVKLSENVKIIESNIGNNSKYHLSLLFRIEEDYQQVRLNGSGRSVFVLEAEAKDHLPHIKVRKPSDCLALQRENIVCTDIVTIDVWMGAPFASYTSHPDPPEVWQKAVHHILNTYDPEQCYIVTHCKKTGLGDEVRVQTDSNRIYNGFWNENRWVLSLIR